MNKNITRSSTLDHNGNPVNKNIFVFEDYPADALDLLADKETQVENTQDSPQVSPEDFEQLYNWFLS